LSLLAIPIGSICDDFVKNADGIAVNLSKIEVSSYGGAKVGAPYTKDGKLSGCRNAGGVRAIPIGPKCDDL